MQMQDADELKRYDSRTKMTSYIPLTSHLEEDLSLLEQTYHWVIRTLNRIFVSTKSYHSRLASPLNQRTRAEKVECGTPVFVKVG